MSWRPAMGPRSATGTGRASRRFLSRAVYELRGFGQGARTVVGSAEIGRTMEQEAGHPVPHHVTNVIVSVDGGEVRMRSKIIGSGTRGRVGSADYDDVVRQENGAWRIATRVVALRRPDRR
jgi:hypothetical protein